MKARSRVPPEEVGEPAQPSSAVRGEMADLREQTIVGALYLRALMRRQLRLSLVLAAAFVVLIGAQPLLPRLWPQYADLSVLGLPLPWLVLGGLTYPAMVLMGIFYVRRAGAIDDEFTELLR